MSWCDKNNNWHTIDFLLKRDFSPFSNILFSKADKAELQKVGKDVLVGSRSLFSVCCMLDSGSLWHWLNLKFSLSCIRNFVLFVLVVHYSWLWVWFDSSWFPSSLKNMCTHILKYLSLLYNFLYSIIIITVLWP